MQNPKSSDSLHSVSTQGVYRHSLATLTDLYQLTMAYGYFKSGHAQKQSVFHMFFRKNPFGGGFAVAAGLASLIELIENYRFEGSDLEFLARLCGVDGKPLFGQDFLEYLSDLKLTVDIDAVAEGEIVFAHEPMVRVTGSLIECQLLETAILNFFNFQTLIATKAARVKLAAQGRPVLEFGLRRAQGPDGALTASRCSYLGGCDATSNLLAGRLYGIPVKGTHAHSWVMSYPGELAAFRQYAAVMPNNCIFLVDTYDTLTGVKHAIEIGQELREGGHELSGVRLDSGDLAYLSIEARNMLDEAGFRDAQIVASNDLDEAVIASLVEQGAMIDVWGVGTKLVTAEDQPALGGVYKLSCVRDSVGEPWQPRLKLSEQAIKISTPGIHQVRRYFLADGSAYGAAGSSEGAGSRAETGSETGQSSGSRRFIADMIFDLNCEDSLRSACHGEQDRAKARVKDKLTESGDKFGDKFGDAVIIVDPVDFTRRKSIPPQAQFEDLLVPIYRGGKLVYQLPTLAQSRAFKEERIKCFHPTILRLLNPHQYPVGLECGLHKMKLELILKARGFAEEVI
jgi:nicotinate phosphoribosyltransferase